MKTSFFEPSVFFWTDGSFFLFKVIIIQYMHCKNRKAKHDHSFIMIVKFSFTIFKG